MHNTQKEIEVYEKAIDNYGILADKYSGYENISLKIAKIIYNMRKRLRNLNSRKKSDK